MLKFSFSVVSSHSFHLVILQSAITYTFLLLNQLLDCYVISCLAVPSRDWQSPINKRTLIELKRFVLISAAERLTPSPERLTPSGHKDCCILYFILLLSQWVTITFFQLWENSFNWLKIQIRFKDPRNKETFNTSSLSFKSFILHLIENQIIRKLLFCNSSNCILA